MDRMLSIIKNLLGRRQFWIGVCVALTIAVMLTQQTSQIVDVSGDSNQKLCTCPPGEHESNDGTNPSPDLDNLIPTDSEFRDVVRSRVRHDGVIITPAVIDKGYLDMARNLYITSIVPHNLTAHTLFLCVDREACDAAAAHGLPTFLFKDYNKENTGDFGSSVFKQKAMMKHYMIYDILKMGYSVLLSDLDMYWFKNPLDDVIKRCGSCDFAIQSEAKIELNIGFMYVRPTKRSIDFYKKVIAQAEKKGGQGAQGMFNGLVRTHKKHISYKVIDVNLYPDGLTYFEKARRRFVEQNPCKSCFICHNNWIVGTEAKTYRFREHRMWMVDEGYYSDPDALYLVYDNPYTAQRAGKTLPDLEIRALKAALAIGEILGRIVIIPHAFHDAARSAQPMNGVLRIRELDASFRGKYRESTFLSHPLVPAFPQKCGSFLIQTNFTRSQGSKVFPEDKLAKVFVPADTAGGATDAEILDWFSSYKTCQVMTFHSLYNAFKGYTDKVKDAEMKAVFSKALVKGQYRQLELLRKKKG